MTRRKFTREFKVSAARLVTAQGYSAADAARNLGVDPASIRSWVKKYGSPPNRVTAYDEPLYVGVCGHGYLAKVGGCGQDAIMEDSRWTFAMEWTA